MSEEGLFNHLSSDELFEGRRATGFRFRKRNPHMFGPKSPSKVKFKRGLLVRGDNLDVIARMLAKGESSKQICRETGICMVTIAKMRKVIETERGKPLLCSCGQKAGHISWCPVREAQQKPGTYKLTPDKVRRIRALAAARNMSFAAIGREFGVAGKTISRIVKPNAPRAIWRNV